MPPCRHRLRHRRHRLRPHPPPAALLLLAAAQRHAPTAAAHATMTSSRSWDLLRRGGAAPHHHGPGRRRRAGGSQRWGTAQRVALTNGGSNNSSSHGCNGGLASSYPQWSVANGKPNGTSRTHSRNTSHGLEDVQLGGFSSQASRDPTPTSAPRQHAAPGRSVGIEGGVDDANSAARAHPRATRRILPCLEVA